MISKENFDTATPWVEAIPANEVKIPNMLVDKYLQEAADMANWSKEDQSKLETV